MIAALRGTVLEHTDRGILLEVNGVVYEIAVTPQTQRGWADDATALVYVHWHERDEGPSLYGFLTLHERNFFQLLLTVSGVGPKGAMAILGLGNMADVQHSIAAGDAKLLTSVTGIGKKIAQRLIIELKDKIGESGAGLSQAGSSVVEALERLGYSSREARDVIAHLTPGTTIEEQVRQALQHLGKRT